MINEIPTERLLLSKFPIFNPVWSDEVKKKWWEIFKELMALYKKGSKKKVESGEEYD